MSHTGGILLYLFRGRFGFVLRPNRRLAVAILLGNALRWVAPSRRRRVGRDASLRKSGARRSNATRVEGRVGDKVSAADKLPRWHDSRVLGRIANDVCEVSLREDGWVACSRAVAPPRLSLKAARSSGTLCSQYQPNLPVHWTPHILWRAVTASAKLCREQY